MSVKSSGPPDDSGIQTLKSPDSFSGTVKRLTEAFQSHGIKIFAIIDQQAEAAAAGLSMPPVTLILFGNPKAGTALMIAQPTSALDLPLKALVWASEENEVFVSFNMAAYIIARHGLPLGLVVNIAPAEKLIAAAMQRKL